MAKNQPSGPGTSEVTPFAVFFLALGLVLMVVWRVTTGRTFFTRRGGGFVPEEIAAAALGPTKPGVPGPA